MTTRTRRRTIVGLLLAAAFILGVYFFVVRPLLTQAEVENRALAYVTQADRIETTAELVVGHEHAPDTPARFGRTIEDPARVELLLSAVKWTIEHGHRDRWSHYSPSQRLVFSNPSGKCVIWLAADRSGWSFGEQPNVWYGGGNLLHLVFGVIYLAAGRDSNFYLMLLGYVGAFRYVAPEYLAECAGFMAAVAPLVAEIEENPETPMKDFWEVTGLSKTEFVDHKPTSR